MAKLKRIRIAADRSRWADVEDLLHFVELRNFTTNWRSKLELNDDDLLELQLAIMLAPKGNPVVPGTGSLRKLRFSPSRWRRGKRGALRVGYAYFEDLKIVLLGSVYPKNEKDDLTAAEREEIRKLLAEIHEQYSQHHYQ